MIHSSKCTSSQDSFTSVWRALLLSKQETEGGLHPSFETPMKIWIKIHKGPPDWCTVMSLWFHYVKLLLVGLSGSFRQKITQESDVWKDPESPLGVFCMILHFLNWCRGLFPNSNQFLRLPGKFLVSHPWYIHKRFYFSDTVPQKGPYWDPKVYVFQK